MSYLVNRPVLLELHIKSLMSICSPGNLQRANGHCGPKAAGLDVSDGGHLDIKKTCRLSASYNVITNGFL